MRFLPASRSARIELLLALVVALAFAALAAFFSARYFYNVVDDALISVHYGENLAQGHGAVFNVGERVEGYTNFLWMLVSALLYWPARALGVELVHALVAVNVAVAASVVGMVLLLSRRLWPGRVWPAVAATGLTALDNGYGVWAVLGLEKHFVAFWALLALLLASKGEARSWPRIGLCIACAMLTRPDGGLFAVALLGSGGLALWWSGGGQLAIGRPPSWRALWLAAGVWVGVYAAYYVWRYSYYGYPLPNTFYLKVGGSKLDAWDRGVGYLKDFLSIRAYVPALGLLALAGLAQPLVRALWLWAAAHVLYITYVGGDFYPGHRFFIAIVPALALLVGQLVFQLEWLAERVLHGSRSRIVARHALIAAVACGLTGVVAVRGLQRGPYRTEIATWGPVVERNYRYMRWVRDHVPPGSSMVVGDIGSAGHYAGLFVYDFYGVIDPTIAHQDVATLGKNKAGHEKMGTAEYFLPKRPTLIKWGYLRGELYANGYYARGDIPLELGAEGLWQLDPLRDRGRFLPETKLSFTRRDAKYALSGDAFTGWPRYNNAPHQQWVEGQFGSYVSSFHPQRGDAATGSFTTPPFVLVGDLLTVRVAGGYDPERLAVEL
ncbi:MAG TPA: hypothetical protein VK509_06380, partial [Polyangiales bacterium]|nr:hypothetical protein [Polyangiales bacterium]